MIPHWNAPTGAATTTDDLGGSYEVIRRRLLTTAEALGQKAEQLNVLWHQDHRVNPWQGTAYGVVAAVNTWTHHELPVRGADRGTRNTERVIAGKIDQLDRHTLAVLATV